MVICRLEVRGGQQLTRSKSYDSRHFSRCFALAFVAAVSVMSMLPQLPGVDLGLFRQLNQELGELCQRPPERAMKVCRLHARLVNG